MSETLKVTTAQAADAIQIILGIVEQCGDIMPGEIRLGRPAIEEMYRLARDIKQGDPTNG